MSIIDSNCRRSNPFIGCRCKRYAKQFSGDFSSLLQAGIITYVTYSKLVLFAFVFLLLFLLLRGCKKWITFSSFILARSSNKLSLHLNNSIKELLKSTDYCVRHCVVYVVWKQFFDFFQKTPWIPFYSVDLCGCLQATLGLIGLCFAFKLQLWEFSIFVSSIFDIQKSTYGWCDGILFIRYNKHLMSLNN